MSFLNWRSLNTQRTIPGTGAQQTAKFADRVVELPSTAERHHVDRETDAFGYDPGFTRNELRTRSETAWRFENPHGAAFCFFILSSCCLLYSMLAAIARLRSAYMPSSHEKFGLDLLMGFE